MKDQPILFSGPMVRAILAGTKTQTRRVCKGARELSRAADWPLASCPYGVPGDRLWVRETWRELGSFMTDAGERMTPLEIVEEYGLDPECCVYRADEDGSGGPWRPGIFMPRAVSRITLEITDVRVQRLQEISEDDIEAEGVSCPRCHGVGYERLAESFDNCREPSCGDSYRPWWIAGWDTINGKRAPWASNPWVWAIAFRRVA